MWTQSHTQVYQGVKKEDIWRLWIDVNNWHKWAPDIDYARMEGPFVVDSHFIIKPKGKPEVKLHLVEVEPLKKYTDTFKFFGATLYGIHKIEETKNGLKLTITIQITGPLQFIWKILVGRRIENKIAEQMDALVALARSHEA